MPPWIAAERSEATALNRSAQRAARLGNYHAVEISSVGKERGTTFSPARGPDQPSVDAWRCG